MREIADQMRNQMIPLSARFSYFFTAMPLGDDDVKEYLDDPIAALPPAVRSILPEVAVLLVPYIEKAVPEGEGEEGQDRVCFEEPPVKVSELSSRVTGGGTETLFFAIKDLDVSEYHYCFFRRLASVAYEYAGEEVRDKFSALLREELEADAHGEVEEESWQLKQSWLQQKEGGASDDDKFGDYSRQALLDTFSLYLHGICCDIDVETGPRQLPSRYLRRRLELLKSFFPPPEGYAVFPEDLNNLRSKR